MILMGAGTAFAQTGSNDGSSQVIEHCKKFDFKQVCYLEDMTDDGRMNLIMTSDTAQFFGVDLALAADKNIELTIVTDDEFTYATEESTVRKINYPPQFSSHRPGTEFIAWKCAMGASAGAGLGLGGMGAGPIGMVIGAGLGWMGGIAGTCME